MKKKEVFRGSAVALITPFRKGKIDFEALSRLIEFQIAGGSSAIVACGTTGEAATLSASEQAEVISFVISEVGGRLPVIAGTGCNDTARAIAQSREACRLGADALLVVTPYYNKATPAGLEKHYLSIIEACDKPVIIYNVPTRTCVDIPVEIISRLSEHEMVAGLKEASPDVSRAERIMSVCGDSLPVYSGNDDLTLPLLSLGASGVISVAANIVPELMSGICSAFFAGDMKEAAKLALYNYDLMRAMFFEVNPIPVKTTLERMGFCSSEMRLPMCEISDEGRKKLFSVLERHGL